MSVPSPDGWEQEVARRLDDRVRDLHDAPLSADAVRGRARTVRLRRRLAAAGGVLAAAAVLVPLGLAAAPDVPRGAEPLPATSPSALPSEAAPDAAPGVEHVEGRTLVGADGSRLTLPARYASLARLGDGFAGTRDRGGEDWVLDVLDADGSVVSSTPTFDRRIAVDDARTALAHVDAGGTLHVTTQDGERSLGDVGAGASPVALTGDCAGAGDSCRVYLEVVAGDGGAVVVDGDGRSLPVTAAARGVADAAEDGRVAFTTTLTSTGPCSEVLRGPEGRRVARTCDVLPRSFSPDGRLMTGSPTYVVSLGEEYVAVLDAATLTEQTRYAPRGAVVQQAVWADDTTLAVLTYARSGRWQVVRVAADGPDAGTGEVVAEASGAADSPPFVLLTG